MSTAITEVFTPSEIASIRAEFPILNSLANGQPLVYFDNAATTQKPRSVIDAIERYYRSENANIHRGVHFLSQKATNLFEASRTKIRKFINAKRDEEIIFTRGTTESINLVASSLSWVFKAGDEIMISAMEHHSNIVPWQIMRDRIDVVLKIIPVSSDGTLEYNYILENATAATKLIAINHVSNALGTINPVREICQWANSRNILTLIDGAQSVSHMQVDVNDLDCDFYCFSGHKMFGPTGIGVLYGKFATLAELPVYHGGGEMIKSVSFEKTIYNDLPARFEAGTPHIEGAICLGNAIDFINEINRNKIHEYENQLLEYSEKKLLTVPGLRIIGQSPQKAGLHSFVIDKVHPHDLGTLLDEQGIAIRTGHHCAQPILNFFGVTATARISFSVYNTFSEIDFFIEALQKAIRILR